MRQKSSFFTIIVFILFSMSLLPNQFVQAGDIDDNVFWNELYHSAPGENARTELVPSLADSFFAVDPSGNYYPSTQARVYILVEQNDIVGGQVIYWDGSATQYASMSYVSDVTVAFRSQPSHTYSIWMATLPAPNTMTGPLPFGTVYYRIQVWDGPANAFLRASNGAYINPLGQHVIGGDSPDDNYGQFVNDYPTVSINASSSAGESIADRQVILTLSSSINQAVTVDITYADGTAVAGTNYTTTTTSLTIPANTTNHVATLPGLVLDSGMTDPSLDFSITLANVATGNAVINGGADTHTFTITQEDTPIVQSPPVQAPPPIPQKCDVGGFSFALPSGVFCTNLVVNGAILIPGSIPANLASRVMNAVDIGTYDGKTVAPGEFGTGLPVCLSGQGRLFFLDASTSPRAQFELNTFSVDGKTCGFIVNSGTVVLITP